MITTECLGKFEQSFIKQKFNKLRVYKRTVNKYENNQIFVNAKATIGYTRFVGSALEEKTFISFQSGYNKDLDNANDTLLILIDDYLMSYKNQIDLGETVIHGINYSHKYIIKFPKRK